MSECCGNPLRGCANCPPPKKLTFEDYWKQQGFDTDSFMLRLKHEFEICWQVAQENK